MTMAHFQRAIVDDAGNLKLSGTVTVTKESDATLAATKSSRDGSSGLTNPITVTDGILDFYVEGGAYRLQGTFGSYSFDWRYVAVGTAQEMDRDLIVQSTQIREKLTANRTYYVRTDGSNSNDGLTNSSGGAFLTIQKAWDTLVTIDLNGYTVTIQIADGTYTGGLSASAPPVGGSVIINGNSSTPANVIISTTGSNCFYITAVASVTIQNLEMRTTTSGSCIAATGAGAKISMGAGLRFGACAGTHIYAVAGGFISILSLYAITGAAAFHYYFDTNSVASMNGSLAITNSGTNAFTYFAVALNGGIINTAGNTYTGGTITGPRYLASTNGVIQTYGGGASYFPGDSAGSTSSGGQYA